MTELNEIMDKLYWLKGKNNLREWVILDQRPKRRALCCKRRNIGKIGGAVLIKESPPEFTISGLCWDKQEMPKPLFYEKRIIKRPTTIERIMGEFFCPHAFYYFLKRVNFVFESYVKNKHS
jgi:hypothetical protein